MQAALRLPPSGGPCVDMKSREECDKMQTWKHAFGDILRRPVSLTSSLSVPETLHLVNLFFLIKISEDFWVFLSFLSDRSALSS